MLQYITAVSIGITSLWDLVRGTVLKGNETLEKAGSVSEKGYAGVVFLGLSFTAGLLLLLISGESLLLEIPEEAVRCIGIISGISGVMLLGVLIKYEIINRRFQRLSCSQKVLKKENMIMQHKISDLLTHSDIARAAANSKTFGCFMGSIARLLRTDKAARELTVFTCNDSKFLPHTYYQFSDFSELSLSFSQKDVEKYLKQNDNAMLFDCSSFSARNLVLEYSEGHITIEGGLLSSGFGVGRIRIILFNCSELSHSFGDLLEGIVDNALSSVRIEREGLFEAMNYVRPVLSEVSNSSGVLMRRLEVENNILGVVRLRFKKDSNLVIKRQKTILQNASSHISKALYNQRLYEFAVKDGLTGLYNKRYLMEMLDKNCTDYLMGSGRLSFTLIDIDFFKKVNDTWGHLVGDEVLKKVAEVITSVARESDIVARYGGEELAVLMPETDIEGAEILAERVRVSIENENYVTAEGESFSVTASFGVAEMENGMMSAQELIEYADRALYLAKGSGRNRVVVSGSINVLSDVA